MLLIWILALACVPDPPASPRTAPEAPAEAEPDTVTPEPGWVAERVAEAEARLKGSEGGRQLWAAIDAHGGLATWYGNGPVAFRFDYEPLNGRTERDTRQLVNTWSSRAVHTLASNEAVRFGWDGEQAWAQVPEGAEIEINPRFWALTPYYFVGMPFVLADPGVELAAAGPGTFEDQPCDLVRATFTEGTGDAPDDYYVLYLRQDDHHLVALRYVVSYPGFFDEGEHSPEKLMSYDGAQTVAGITFAEKHRTFLWTGSGVGEQVTETTVTEVAFLPVTLPEAFEVPKGARIVGAL